MAFKMSSQVTSSSSDLTLLWVDPLARLLFFLTKVTVFDVVFVYPLPRDVENVVRILPPDDETVLRVPELGGLDELDTVLPLLDNVTVLFENGPDLVVLRFRIVIS